MSIPDWPKFPHIQVDVRDLTDESEPWELINRCVFASKRAGLSVIEIMRFTNQILYFYPTYADAFVHCLLTFRLRVGGDVWQGDEERSDTQMARVPVLSRSRQRQALS